MKILQDYFKQEHLESLSDGLVLLFTGCATALTALVGGFDTAFEVFITVIVLDVITGVLKSLWHGEFISKRMRQGFKTKLGYIIVIVLAVAFDRLMPSDMPLMRTIVLYFYIAVEGSSILENLAQMGVPIPQVIIDRLAVIKGKSGNEAKVDEHGKFDTKGKK